MAKIGALNVDLSLETARFHKSMKGAEKDVGKMQKTMGKAVKAIGAAFAGLAVADLAMKFRDMSKAAIGAAGDLGEQAAALGITTTALQEYRYAATQVALTNEDVDQLFQQLTRRTGDAAQGIKESADAFKRLGIDFKDANGNVRNSADMLPEIADALQRVPSEAERAAIMVDLFGRSGQKAAALFANGSAGIDQYRKAAHDLGTVLSEEEIANADVVADKIAALNYQIEAQSNKKLLENKDAILAFEEGLGDMKLAAIDAVVGLQNLGEGMDNAVIATNSALHDFADAVDAQLHKGHVFFKNFAVNASAAMQRMYTGVKTWLQDKLGIVFDWVNGKIEKLERAFHWLGDQVVFNSHIPDMVDQIGKHMGRLDKLMVDPTIKATQSTEDAFRNMAMNVRYLLDRLYPDIARMQELKKQIALINGAEDAKELAPELASDARIEAQKAARRDIHGDSPSAPTSATIKQPLGVDWAATEKQMGKFGFLTGALADKTKINTVRIAESFKDMAQKTMQAFSSLVSAIKGGSFLGILEGAVGLFMQLGSSGVFGKGLAANLNSPAFGGFRADGGPISAGRAYMVGERGPELVVPRHGGHVISNEDLRGGGRGGSITVNVNAKDALLTHTVKGWVAEGVAIATQNGAQLSHQQRAFHQSRRFR